MSYADVITTPTVLDPVIKTLPLNTTAAELGAQISADVPANTVKIRCSPWEPSTDWSWDWS